MRAQDVDRAQTHHPPDPGRGRRSSCCRLGTRAGGGGEGPLENTRVWGGEGNYMARYCHQNSGPWESL